MYRSGIIRPIKLPSELRSVTGIAIANREPHRPEELDLFIDFTTQSKAARGSWRPPKRKWPDLLAKAREFSVKHPGGRARFAVLRLWSSPYFWTVMQDAPDLENTSFLDPLGRGWTSQFMLKDRPNSEEYVYDELDGRLKHLERQFRDRVMHRANVVLVMGTSALELFRYAVAVTFVLQARKWNHEVDLWKSFVNVDLGFLEGLDSYWLD